jgi:hypothetical protein
MAWPHSRHLPLVVSLLATAACADDGGGAGPDAGPSAVWDIDGDGIPALVDDSYLDVAALHRISRFRSGAGLNDSDDVEYCRSMKHYLEPRAGLVWTTLDIRAPVTGMVSRIDGGSTCTTIEIVMDRQPAFRFVIGHVAVADDLDVGSQVTAGQLLGHHASSGIWSEIVVIVTDPAGRDRFVSYFDVMTDDAFAAYQRRGVATRGDLVISRAERDQHRLSCYGDLFVNPDSLPNWVVLR